MKKHFSKRLTALFLAVVLLATSAPVIAYAYNKGESSADTKYLFAYFTSNSQYGQQIRFAVSEDGYNYQPLNYNRPIIHTKKELSILIPLLLIHSWPVRQKPVQATHAIPTYLRAARMTDTTL